MLSSKSHLSLLHGSYGALMVVKPLHVVQVKTRAGRQGLKIFFVSSFHTVSWILLTSGGSVNKMLKETLVIS